MKKKLIIFGIILFILLIGGVFFFSNKINGKNETLNTATVEKGNLRVSFSIDGKSVIERYDPQFSISGKIVHIGVIEGQEVKKGQYLIGLDTQEVRKNLEKILKDYLISRNDFDQGSDVTYPNGALNDTIKRILEKNQYNLDKAVLDVELKDIALREAYLYSPIDGIVSALNIKEGEIVSTQGTNSIITITKPNSLYFEAEAEDIDVLKINKEQKISMKFDALPGVSFKGEVFFISNLANIDSNGLATYKVKAIIENPSNINILDGMTGQITFTTKEKLNILTIPNKAVYRKNNVSYVKKLINNKPQEIEVITGFTDGKSVEVIQGLDQNDQIIIP